MRPIITETPPYARAGGFAMMDTPGAYETKATEAFYYVTPPEKDWPAKQKDEHLRLFNRPVMEMITIHEAWPGHYPAVPVRKAVPHQDQEAGLLPTNVEGWAHYAEQMMVEEGFGNGDPKIKLAQLSEALLRDCRYVVGIRLHTKGMTVEEGARLFMEKGFAERPVALEEARRGAYDPTYLYYTLGKLMIYKMRDDYRKAKGGLLSGGIPRRIRAPGRPSHPVDAAHHASGRHFAATLILEIHSMQNRQLGNSDMMITPLGVGAWAMGGGGWQFAWGPQDDNESIGAIHAALDAGINWIDTAAVYGLGHSEEVVARALAGRSNRPYIFTKCERVWDENGKIGGRLKRDRSGARWRTACGG